MKFLCTGDIHIGRRPVRLPGHLDTRRFSASAAWDAIVEHAVAERVDGVMLTGDVVDRSNRFFEAYGPLERGVRRLAEAGIDVFAVAGNHDFDVLPRLIESVGAERFHLLGRGGRWERVTIQRDGAGPCHIAGWSFPAEHVRTNPLETWNLPGTGDAPTIGLLHADLDQAGSRYAPVSLADLQTRPVSLWLLGHIHHPRLHEASGQAPRVLYPGSPEPLDPSESGPHGPWLTDVESAYSVRVWQVPLARVRYDRLDVDLTGVGDWDEARGRMATAVREHLQAVSDQGGAVEHVRCRLRLWGRTPLHRRLCDGVAEVASDLEVSLGSLVATVDRLEIETRPPVDLGALSGGRGAAATLARLLLTLEQNGLDGPQASLIQRARQQMVGVYRAKPYSRLHANIEEDHSPDTAAARETLLRQGWLLLDALLAQREGEQ